MTTFSLNSAEFAWPLTIALAWIMGEFSYRYTQLPRISIYTLVGFLIANSKFGFLLHQESSAILLPANIAFGLILFEFGYCINLRWLKSNPWIGVTGLIESAATFIAIYLLAQWYGASTFISLSLAALAMATSPAEVMRVMNEQRSSGQVTERIMHLSAFNCVLAVFAFNVIGMLQTTGNLYPASIDSLLMLILSITLGAIFGIVLPIILRWLGNLAQDATTAFAISVILMVALAYATKLSPILAALTFGLTARHRRVTLIHTKRNFGALGDLLTVMLFVFVASTLDWQRAMAGASLGLAIVAVRFGTKTFATTLFAPVSGISLRKGILSGIGLAPISVFVVLTLEQARYSGLALVDELETLEALAAVILLLGMIGPIITRGVLMLAKETKEDIKIHTDPTTEKSAEK